eukprot:TRINITY_DN81045_c0_g1_i1.p1 TRINITY_DN81045_c0_g1~~TRINITY_DN81045_c0_g1_i1.p1  ORF type:complete len:422 (+),score=131.21 TRINITY_DN81045_c0_g1_i1:238-1503(+)
MSRDLEIKEAFDKLTDAGVRYVQYHFTDLLGALRCMEENRTSFISRCKNGLSIDGSSVPGYQSVEASDMLMIPELETLCIFTLEGETVARVMCHAETPDHVRKLNDPRNILFRAQQLLKNLGLSATLFSELEFIMTKDMKPVDEGGYLDMPPLDGGYKYRHDLGDKMIELGIDVRRLHHECAAGQNEVEYNLTPAMKNADDSLTGMWLAKFLAQKMGIECRFTPKPLVGHAGNGLHQHIKLTKLEDGANAMSGEGDEALSEIGLKFIAGLVKHASEITAIFAHTSETFMRLSPGFEAPVHAAWDFSNRTALVRVPQITSKDGTRVEFRAGDASGSVHLLSAALLFAGAVGIRDDYPIIPNVSLNFDHTSKEELEKRGIERLPSSIEECFDIMRGSALCKELLGEEIIEKLIELRSATDRQH